MRSLPANSPRREGDAAPAAVRLPPFERFALPNGLQVVVCRRAQLPLASVELLLEVGGAHDPAGKAGLASMTASLLRRGTENRSADEIHQAIEYVGGHLDTHAGPDATTVSAGVTSENLALALELVADVALHPAFPKKEFDTQQRRTLAELAQELDEPGVVGDRVMLRTVLPAGHPYALPTAGTRVGVAALRRADLQRFHRTFYVPGRATLIVVGDVDPAEVRRLARRFFGGWEAREAPVVEAPAPAPLRRNRILVVHKEQATQVQVRFVAPAFARKTDPIYFPATVANVAFGGGFTSRLVDEIRVNRGLSYNANTRFLQLRGAGFFVFKSFTKNESVGELLQVLLDQAEKARRGGFDEAEIERARSYLAGLYPLRLETNDQIAAALGEMLLYDLPTDWVERYRANLAAVTVQQANEAARAHFFPGPCGIVLVGDRKAIEAGLSQAGIEGEVAAVPIARLDEAIERAWVTGGARRGAPRASSAPPRGSSPRAMRGSSAAAAPASPRRKRTPSRSGRGRSRSAR